MIADRHVFVVRHQRIVGPEQLAGIGRVVDARKEVGVVADRGRHLQTAVRGRMKEARPQRFAARALLAVGIEDVAHALPERHARFTSEREQWIERGAGRRFGGLGSGAVEQAMLQRRDDVEDLVSDGDAAARGAAGRREHPEWQVLDREVSVLVGRGDPAAPPRCMGVVDHNENPSLRRYAYATVAVTLPHRRGQPEGDLRKDHQEDRGDHDRQHEHAGALIDLHQVHAGRCGHDEGDQPDRRKHEPHRHHHHRQHSEPDRVEAERSDQRERQLQRQEEERNLVHEHADHEIGDHDAADHHPAIEVHRGDGEHHVLGNAAERHVVAEDGGADQDEEDHRRGADRRSQGVDRVRPSQPAEGRADDTGEERAQRADLGRRRDAGIEQHENQQDEQEARPDADEARPALLGIDFVSGGRMLGIDQHPEIDHGGEQHADNDARDDARNQELADRGLGGDTVDHHGDARRDQDVERCADADRAGRKLVGIAMAAHLRHRDLGHYRRGGGAGARHRAEDAASEHGGDREAAADVRAPIGRGGVEVARQSTRGGEERHQDEHRDGGERVVGDRAERSQAQDPHHFAEVAGDQIDAEQARARERYRDRHAEEEGKHQHE